MFARIIPRATLRTLSSYPTCSCPVASTSKALFHSTPRFNSAIPIEATPLQELPIVTVVPLATPVKRKPRVFKASKAAISLTPTAVDRIRDLLNQPTPQLIRIGVKNKGCAGMSYHLEYVDKPERFDEIVLQDGVKVVLDSKALFSIIGSEMDWQEDALGAKFVFKNPNIKDACGCGESFTV